MPSKVDVGTNSASYWIYVLLPNARISSMEAFSFNQKTKLLRQTNTAHRRLQYVKSTKT